MLLYYNKRRILQKVTTLIPNEIKKIYENLSNDNFEVFLVGGCVRNLLMKIPVKDWDITTNATPEEILKLFPNGFYNNTFGTVGIPIENEKVAEVTTYRTEQGFTNKRHPDSVSWGKNILEDLARRDFTMNAIALKFAGKSSYSAFEITDPYDGQNDIKKKLIRSVGNPSERFKEDALRLLRAVRFASQLNFLIEEKTWSEIKNDSALIKEISGERIRIELLKIMESEDPEKGIELLRESELLNWVLPELLEGIGVSQVRPGRHHTSDVYTHNIMSLKLTPATDPIVRFATLLHDVGKPRVRGEDKDGLVTFYNHEVAGAKMAYEICERLKFSKKDRTKVVTLIRWHMFTVDDQITDSAIRRFIRRVGVENVADVIDLRIGDRLGSNAKKDSWRLTKFKERITSELGPKPFSINDLAIDGNDLMKELNLKPGPEIGKILQQLFEEVDEDISKNNKDYLMERLKKLQY